jgi:hypothetical protein
MVMGFWGLHSRQDSALRGRGHNSEEAVVARRARIPTLEIRITFEPSRVSPEWGGQAYEQVVPRRRRPASEHAAPRLVRREPLTQLAGRREAS